MLKFIKKLFFGEAKAWIDIEINSAPQGWHIPKMDIINAQIVYGAGDELSLTYMGDKNRLELNIDGKSTPANVTTRVQRTINNRLKKAGKEEIPQELFDLWEAELIDAQGTGKNTYASKRIKK